MKGKTHEYSTSHSSFVRPEIQGLLEVSLKSGILTIGRDKFDPTNYIVSTTELGLVMLSVEEVVHTNQYKFVSFISLADAVLEGLRVTHHEPVLGFKLGYHNCPVYYTFEFENRGTYNEWLSIIQGSIKKLQDAKQIRTVLKV